MKDRSRDLIEVCIFLCLLAIYVIFRKELSGRIFFIGPVVLGVCLYVAFCTFRRSNFLEETGLNLDSIVPSAKLTLIYSLPFTLGIFLLYPFTDNPRPPMHFYLLFLLYPIWGIIQQFMFQSFLQARLLRLGCGKASILIAAVVFAFAHWPSKKLVPAAFLAGLFFSFTFFKHRNIIPIGIAHGILGALFYQFILGKDVLKKFLGY